MVFRGEEELVPARVPGWFRQHSDAKRGGIPSLHIAAAYACFWGTNKGWDDRQQRDRVVRVSVFLSRLERAAVSQGWSCWVRTSRRK